MLFLSYFNNIFHWKNFKQWTKEPTLKYSLADKMWLKYDKRYASADLRNVFPLEEVKLHWFILIKGIKSNIIICKKINRGTYYSNLIN